jgi:hypothetical protein
MFNCSLSFECLCSKMSSNLEISRTYTYFMNLANNSITFYSLSIPIIRVDSMWFDSIWLDLIWFDSIWLYLISPFQMLIFSYRNSNHNLKYLQLITINKYSFQTISKIIFFHWVFTFRETVCFILDLFKIF